MIVYLISMPDSRSHPVRAPGRPVDPAARLERSARILAGARECFIQNGFHKASIGDVAAAAGVSVANIYQYFESKDAMILALVEANLEADRALVASLAASRFEPAALAAAMDALFLTEEAIKSARMRGEMLSEAARNPAVAAVLRRADEAGIDAMAKSLAEGQQHGIVAPEVDPRTAAQMLSHLFEGLLSRLSYDPAAGPQLIPLATSAVIHILHLSHR
jgi:AcrR family transcriptional regulator